MNENIKLIIWGTGRTAAKLLSYKLRKNVEIICICDNNKSMQGSMFAGYVVQSPYTIATLDYTKIVLAMWNGKALNEIIDQLSEMGIGRDRIVFSYSDFAFEICENDLDEYFEIPKKNYDVKFQKGPAIIYDNYTGETSRCHDRRVREGFIDKYCQGDGLDIGYGADLIVPNCSGWDMRNGDAQYIKEVENESFDFVYASHCLEHMRNVRIALKNWFRAVKHGGFLIIAVPHRDFYEKKASLPSRWNGDHKHMFLLGKKEAPDTLDIMEEIAESITNYEIVYSKVCDYGHTIDDPMLPSDGEYQIEVVIKKL